MGAGFVEAFYRTLLGSNLGFGFLAEEDGRALGYATGVVHWRRFYRTFLMRNLPMVAGVVIRQVFAFGLWRRLFETSRYAATATLPEAELLSIAVRPEARGTGTADALVRAVLAEFARRGVRHIRVTTAAENVAAAKVYERWGFRLLGEKEIHRGEEAHVYVVAVGEGTRAWLR